MTNIHRVLSVLALVALLSLTCTSTVHAFDGRTGDRVVIESNEVINDDLYVTAREFILDGTVNGDLIVMGQTATINGTVEGDLMAAGQTVIVNGSVTGAIRMAGSVLLVDENASIGGDIVGAGYSLEVREGSVIGQDLVFGGGQILLAGEVTRNVQVGTGAFELRGAVGGNIKADVGESNQAGPPPTLFMPQSPVVIPTVQTGLTVDPNARIEGDLEYTQSMELALPAGVVAGQVIRNEPPVDQTAARQETTGDRILTWGINLLRTSFTLILIGLVLLWLFPFFMQGASGKLRSAVLPSLGWGALGYAAFFILLLIIIIVTILGGLLFATLTLGGLAGTVFSLGALAFIALIVGFILATAFVAKIVFGQALGRWILVRANSPLAEHWFWPMIIGVLITVVVIALLSFPLIPGFLGGLLNLVVILFGLGALLMWGRERTARRPMISG
jgi:cytoskeletal protein CcmA (bactofilin family)